MQKILAIVKKDLKIMFKSPMALVLFLGMPLGYLIFVQFIVANETNDLKFHVANSLAQDFNNKDTLTINYLEEPVKITVSYLQKDSLLAEFEHGNIAIAYYEEAGEKVMHLNMNKNNANIIFNILKEKFYPVKEKKFTLKKKFSMNYMLLSMVMNFLLIFSSISYGSSFLEDEIQKQNILFLLKAGLRKSEIILSKILGVLLIQLVAFTIFYLVAVLTGMLQNSLSLFLYLPLIIIPAALTGLCISSITTNKSLKGILPMLFWFPSLIFPLIKENISDITATIIKLNPLVVVIDLIEQVIRNDISGTTLISLSVSTLFMFTLSIIFLKRTIIKSI